MKKTGWVDIEKTGMLPATDDDYEVSFMNGDNPDVDYALFSTRSQKWSLRGDADQFGPGVAKRAASVYAWRCKPEPAPRRKKEQNGHQAG